MKIKNVIMSIRDKIIGETSTEKYIKKGLKVGKNFNRKFGCIIDYSHAWLITIGDNVTLAPRVHIIAHDASTKLFLGCTKIGLINIGNNVFIGAGSIILPNVTIGDNVIIGSGSVVTKDIPSNCVVAGNPAKVLYTIDDYLNKNKKLMNTAPFFGREYTEFGGITVEKKDEMIKKLKSGIGYVK